MVFTLTGSEEVGEIGCFVKVGDFCLVPFSKIITLLPQNFTLLPQFNFSTPSFEEEKYNSLVQYRRDIAWDVRTNRNYNQTTMLFPRPQKYLC